MKIISNMLIESIVYEEEFILEKLKLEYEIMNILNSLNGLNQFAESFYFVRYDFCRLNFILGERCCTNEFLWAGLVKNLYEELGGKSGRSHNQLYRDFVSCVDARPENAWQEPEFARQFNLAWETFCRKAPLAEALSAIAIYEIFDVPDYQLLLRVMKKAGVSQRGLRFFQVHAVANHFEMFEDVVSWLREQEGGEEAFSRAKEFVFQTQTEMWCGLIAHLQEKTTDCYV
jgi:pyrroloquinoline quinone (PQQ) biosynthesis protein C